MTDDTLQKVNLEYPRRLRKIVLGLAVVYVMTFLSGFLQDTLLNFINYIFFFLLFIGGIVLIRATVKSEARGITKVVLFLMGISAILLFMFYIGYELLRLKGNGEFVGSMEALLYLITLFFWIFVIISLVLIRRIKRHNASQP